MPCSSASRRSGGTSLAGRSTSVPVDPEPPDRVYNAADALVVLHHPVGELALGDVFQQIVHRRIASVAIAERDELIHQIARGLSGETREIAALDPLALPAVTGSAGKQPCLHRIGRVLCRLR